MVNYYTFHIYFLDISYSQNTGKWLQDRDDRQTLGVESLLATYDYCMHFAPNYAFLRLFLWVYIWLIYSISARYLLLNFKNILDV